MGFLLLILIWAFFSPRDGFGCKYLERSRPGGGREIRGGGGRSRGRKGFSGIFGCVGERRAAQLAEKQGQSRGSLGWGHIDPPGKAEGIPAEPTEDGDPQKQRGGYLMRAGDADPGEM